MMISTIPEGLHCPKSVLLKALDVVYGIRDKGRDPKALISRFGWGRLTVYRSTLGTRELALDNIDDHIFSNGVIYRKRTTSVAGDWYILKVWWRINDNNLRLHTYAVGDCGNVIVVDLHEV